MASSSGSVAGSGTENRGFIKPTGDNLDIAWKWNSYTDVSKTTIVCDFCFHPSNEGITRAKKHQLGIPGQVKPCRKIPADIKQQLQESYDKKKASVDAFMSEVVSLNEADESAMEEISSLRAGKRPATGASKTTGLPRRRLTQAMAKQTSIKDSGDNTARAMAIQYVARFFYLNSIPFNVSKSKSFKLMIEAVGNFGKHLRPPNVGAENVVQVVSDNGSNYVLAGKYLEEKYPRLFWTPCAAHCLDLILEDIGKLSVIKKTITRAQFLVGFIYNHTMALNIMRSHTGGAELIRSGVTRFATTFLTLQRLYKQKHNLRRMFVSELWLNTKTAKETKAKRAYAIVLMTSFWNEVLYSIKAMGALVEVLRLVDNEKKLAMGYIYEAMDRAKESIANAFNENERRYSEIFEIIDKRWECQLHRPLHAAGHFLNPRHFYSDQNIAKDKEVTNGLYACIERLSIDETWNDKALTEIAQYRRGIGTFGTPSAVRMRKAMAHAEWWTMYGNHCPHLQSIAIKVLSLTCSSSGCERNWSTFEHIHSKKRSKLEHQRLQDLVFVKYNQALKARFESSDLTDPILLNNIDECYEWLGLDENENGSLESELVFGDDGLTWGDVSDAIGADEPTIVTRNQSRLATTMLNQNEELDVEEEEFESSDEHDNLNLVELASEDEADADVEA
ncbi:hypothetical protein QL285_059395 [Trifolium repens]|nr:hypothetical protein QL285_059395 [Trifolium repens]